MCIGGCGVVVKLFDEIGCMGVLFVLCGVWNYDLFSDFFKLVFVVVKCNVGMILL